MKYNNKDLHIVTAVLAEKVEILSDALVRHMEREEEESKELWSELRKLDKKLMFLAMPLLTLASSGGIPQVVDVVKSVII